MGPCQRAAALEGYDSSIPMEETARTYGVELTSVRQHARSRVEGLAAGLKRER